MTLLMRSLFLGYGVAALAGHFLFAGALGTWLFAWLGGGALSLLFAWNATLIWPQSGAERVTVPTDGTEGEFRKWDQDLAADQFAADLMDDHTGHEEHDRRSA